MGVRGPPDNGTIGGMRNWPLFELRITTPRLELRLPSLSDLEQLADRAVEGVHAPDAMPFHIPWTRAPRGELGRNVIQYHLSTLGLVDPPGNWVCNFVVEFEGVVVGSQSVLGKEFAVRREVSTGSWLGLAYHGRGIGTEMRAAVLEFAFRGLGADFATSGAFLDNAPSLGVSRKLGYREDGLAVHDVDGRRMHEQRLRLRREEFVSPVPVWISGLEPCLPLFGVEPDAAGKAV
jgi:RimJ/RimL family protein N-acetyltransferase